MKYIKVNSKIKINEDEINLLHSKSSGPGGQNVNKTNTKVTLNWNVLDSQSLDNDTKERLLNKLHLTSDYRLLISSDKFRSQDRNKADCINKFIQALQAAVYIPKKRKKTKPTKASKEKRLKEKKSRSEIKKARKNIKF